MRRLLRRSLSCAGDRKSGSRGRRVKRPVSIDASFRADGGDVGANMTRLQVPELHGDCVVDDDSEQLNTAIDWTDKSQRFDQQSDSGCEAGVEATVRREPCRLRVLERQDEVMSSRRSSIISPTSSTSLGRFHRQRVSLRSFRERSGQFIRRRMRPSCLRRGFDSDDTYTARSDYDIGTAAVARWLTVPPTVSLVDGCEQRLAVMPSPTRQSSRSDVTTLPSIGDVSAWNDHGGSLDSSTSATSSTKSHSQVWTCSNQPTHACC